MFSFDITSNLSKEKKKTNKTIIWLIHLNIWCLNIECNALCHYCVKYAYAQRNVTISNKRYIVAKHNVGTVTIITSMVRWSWPIINDRRRLNTSTLSENALEMRDREDRDGNEQRAIHKLDLHISF